MKQAEQLWQVQLMILNLGGYHRKNRYMVKHWDAIQAGGRRRIRCCSKPSGCSSRPCS